MNLPSHNGLYFLKMVMNNFLQFEYDEIIFPKGSISIIGKNGTGKTTILEALVFVLFGEALRGKMDDLMHFNAPPRSHCYVELYFLFKGQKYKICRDTKRPNKTFIEKADGTPIVQGKKDVTEFVVNKLLKMDFTTFCNAFYAKQKEVAALTDMSPTERYNTITKLLRFQAFDVASKIKKEEKKKIDAEIEKIANLNVNEEETESALQENKTLKKLILAELDTLGLSLAEETKQFDGLKQEKETADLSFQAFVRIQNSIESTSQQIDMNENRQLKPNELKRTSLLGKQVRYLELEGVSEELALASEKRDSIRELKGKYDQKVKIFRDLKNIKEAFSRDKTHHETLTLQISGMEACQASLASLETDKTSLVDTIEQIRLDLREEELALHEVKSKAKEKQASKVSYETLGKEAPCPTCGQVLGEKYDLELEKINAAIEEMRPFYEEKKGNVARLQQLLAEKQTQMKTLEQSVQETRRQLMEFEKAASNLQLIGEELKRKKEEFENRKAEYAQYQDIEFDEETLRATESAFQSAQSRYNEYVTLGAEVKQLPELEAHIEETKAIITNLKDNLASYQEQLTALQFDEENYRLLSKRLSDMQDVLSAKRETIHLKKLEIQSLDQKTTMWESMLAQNKANNQKISKLQEESYVKSLLVKAYIECKEQILGEIAPMLSGEMSKDVKTLTNGRYDYVQLDSSFLPFVEKDGKLRNISSFSGGEESVLAISLRLAISKLIVESTGQELEFLALDEIFAFLDHDRVDNVIQLLKEISQKMSQVLIITHEELIQENTDHTMEVYLTANGSSKTRWLKKAGRVDLSHQFASVQEVLDEYVS